MMQVYTLLADRFGPRHWWPAESPFEVCVGAILTQNTAWTNVEKAISALKQADLMSPSALHELSHEALAALIRPAGYFTVKSRRLKAFVAWLFERHHGSLEQLFAGDFPGLRAELLTICGVGPETCDSILLYAGGKLSFVVDTYTRRLFQRLGILSEKVTYDQIRTLFMEHLPAEVGIYNEYHALIVEQCKQFCRKRPHCRSCPLLERCPVGRMNSQSVPD